MIIVSAGILRKNGRILLSQRKPGKQLGLKWEFPGGKLEQGEDPRQTLARELKEELDITVRVGDILDVQTQYAPERDILMLFFFCELAEGEPKCVDCNDIVWVEPNHLLDYDLAPADARIAARLAKSDN